MQHPYGPGLSTPPLGLRPKMAWHLRRFVRVAIRGLLRPFDLLGLKRLRISRLIWVKDRLANEVRHYTLLHPAKNVDISSAGDEEFLNACKHYGSGVVPVADAFVCEVSPALYLPRLGLVANEHFEVFGDSVLLPHRFHLSTAFRSIRPWRIARRSGPVSSIQRIDAYNFWHWMADCLPQILTLERYMDGRPLTLLASEDLGGFQRETLSLMLPATMKTEFVPAMQWIATDRFVLPSYLSGRCNGYLPEDYYAQIRQRIAAGLGLAAEAQPVLRLYLARGSARRRRVSNEAAVIDLLHAYGFMAVRPETLSMRDQVALFQQAAVIVGPHGAALGGMVFAPQAKLLVLYPERHPGEYFYTMARRMGMEHYAIVHDCEAEEDFVEDFAVDLERLRATLDRMGIQAP